MGKKKAEALDATPAPKEEEEEKPEDSPIVKELKALDDQFLEIEREYQRKAEDIRKQFAVRQAPFLAKRAELLVAGVPAEGGAEATPLVAGAGTPAVKDFWCTALKNLPPCSESIEEWDEPVLSYLRDISKEQIEADDNSQPAKGFRLKFLFVENPYFTNGELVKEYLTKEESPYNPEITATSITSTEIEWKAGKDVTVEIVKTKPKGGAKKTKGKVKEKEEPRESFFRIFFQNLKEDEPVPEGIAGLPSFLEMQDEEDDDEGAMEMLMENDYEVGCAIRDMVIPNAVRWYSGEAFPQEDDSDDEDEESEEDDDDDDDEDSEEDEPPRRGGKGGGKGKGGKGAKKPAKKEGGAGNTDAAKEQECKQQ